MAPLAKHVARTALAVTLTSRALVQRDLSVNKTQQITLGIIGLYVVVIAVLWNIPYIKGVLWPFKVSSLGLSVAGISTVTNYCPRCWSLPSMNLGTPSRLS